MSPHGALSPPPPSTLHRLVTLPLVGEYLALGVAGAPLLPMLLAEAILAREPGRSPWFGVAATLVTAGWLVWLQRSQRVRLTLPVPLLWLMPVYLLANAAELLLG